MSKQSLGQYFTKSIVWMQPQIIDFIKATNVSKVLDPFAGNGDLLKASKILGIEDTLGFDIDDNLGWLVNDSLKAIPRTERLIITNPPYLAKNSAKRNNHDTYKYFEDSNYNDLYLLALEKMLKNHDYVVAIIPETFLLSFTFLERISQITILEDNPFEDTDCPVCIVCFDEKNKQLSDIKVFKNDLYIMTLKELLIFKKMPKNSVYINFNDKSGEIGIRCIDGVNNDNDIQFCLPGELNYNLDKISNSSRSITIVKIETDKDIDRVILKANEILNDYRLKTCDLLLAPFKGNQKNNVRRRRLDYKTARAILEEACAHV